VTCVLFHLSFDKLSEFVHRLTVTWSGLVDWANSKGSSFIRYHEVVRKPIIPNVKQDLTENERKIRSRYEKICLFTDVELFDLCWYYHTILLSY
jgi:hypothetical protein